MMKPGSSLLAISTVLAALGAREAAAKECDRLGDVQQTLVQVFGQENGVPKAPFSGTATVTYDNAPMSYADQQFTRDMRQFSAAAHSIAKAEVNQAGDGFTLTIHTWSVASHMCGDENNEQDLVLLYLETWHPARQIPLIHVQPTRATPHAKVVIEFDAAMVKKYIDPTAETFDEFLAKRTFMSVKSQWWGMRSSGTDKNVVMHWNGGRPDKNFKDPAQHVTLGGDLGELTDQVMAERKYNWHGGGPIAGAFFVDLQGLGEWAFAHGINSDRPISLDTELTTSFEIEQEYVLDDGNAHAAITRFFADLSGGQLKSEWARLGIAKVVEKAEKVSYDTYFDWCPKTKGVAICTALPLLRSHTLMRRRWIPGDVKNQFHFSVKGAHVGGHDGPMIRLSSQVLLHTPGVEKNNRTKNVTRNDHLLTFMSDPTFRSNRNNPFANVVTSRGIARPKSDYVTAVLMVRTTRKKYEIYTTHAGRIDVSIDEADYKSLLDDQRGATIEATNDDGWSQDKLYSFELGLGHPAASVAQSMTVGTGEVVDNHDEDQQLSHGNLREYHRRDDLHDDLFDNPSIRAFSGFPAQLLSIGLPHDRPANGGFKAVLAAERLHLIN